MEKSVPVHQLAQEQEPEFINLHRNRNLWMVSKHDQIHVHRKDALQMHSMVCCAEWFNIKISYWWPTHTCKAISLFDDLPLSCFSAKWRWYDGDFQRRKEFLYMRFDLALAAADLGLRGILTNNDHQPIRVVKRFPSQDRSTSEQAEKETNRN